MRNYWDYTRERKRQLCYLAVALLLLGVSGTLLLPHVMEQWSHDRRLGMLHLILGFVTGLAGVTGLLVSWKAFFQRYGTDWKAQLIRWLARYLVIQLAAAIFQGIIGSVLYRSKAASYEMTKQVLHVTSGILQNLIRMGFLLWLAAYVKNWQLPWVKEHLKIPVFAALLFSLAGIGIYFWGNSYISDVIGVLCDTAYLIIAVIICGTLDRRRTT